MYRCTTYCTDVPHTGSVCTDIPRTVRYCTDVPRTGTVLYRYTTYCTDVPRTVQMYHVRMYCTNVPRMYCTDVPCMYCTDVPRILYRIPEDRSSISLYSDGMCGGTYLVMHSTFYIYSYIPLFITIWCRVHRFSDFFKDRLRHVYGAFRIHWHMAGLNQAIIGRYVILVLYLYISLF